MQAIKITIPGQYYDSYIYSGDLMLWNVFGDRITKLKWESFCEWVLKSHVQSEFRFVTLCALQSNDLLYDTKLKYLLDDPYIKQRLKENFERLEKTPINIASENDLTSLFGLKPQANLLPFPHADVLYYHNKLFAGNSKGLFVASKMARRNEKIWDGSALGLSGKNWSVAIAGGADGLFESTIRHKGNVISAITPKLRHAEYTNSVRWMYQNIYGSGYDSGFFAKYTQQESSESKTNKKIMNRILKDTISSEQIFGIDQAGYSWGVHDKMCQIQGTHLNVKQYRPNQGQIGSLQGVNLQVDTDFGDIVSADSAPFGYVIEYDEGLLVVTSDGEQHPIPGEPVNWRVFPNAQHYTNHLHVVYDDELVIYSFYNDYFVDQTKKNIGIRFDDDLFNLHLLNKRTKSSSQQVAPI